jgi:hypothetical protein
VISFFELGGNHALTNADGTHSHGFLEEAVKLDHPIQSILGPSLFRHCLLDLLAERWQIMRLARQVEEEMNRDLA